jgi:hypothetical protein
MLFSVNPVSYLLNNIALRGGELCFIKYLLAYVTNIHYHSTGG